jgi:hypothetical protein
MSNERKPLLSDEWINTHELPRQLYGEERVAMEVGMRLMRAEYERLITEGKLRVVEEVHAVHKLSGLICSNCSITWHNDSCCRGCGNKIKQ